MANKNHKESEQGITRRDVIKGVSAGAAGLALIREGVTGPTEAHGVERGPETRSGNIDEKSEGRKLQPSPDEVEEVLGFISPTYAIPFKIPRA